MEPVRINKYLAEQGLCSRRQGDEWISKGYVYLNGEQVMAPGIKIDPDIDKVDIRKPTEKEYYFLLNKPRGYMSTVLENEGQSLLRLLPEIQGLCPIGRLDKDSEGLIIVTTDRTLTKLVIGEEVEVEKEYEVVLKENLTPSAKAKIEEGLNMFNQRLKPCKIEMLDPDKCRITLIEGKNRQVRRVFQKIGNEVLLLKRIRIGKLTIDMLKNNKYLELNRKSIIDNL